MVVLEGSQMATTTLGGPYAQGAPALKIVQKRFLGLHQWLSPVYSKEIKEQLVSVTEKRFNANASITGREKYVIKRAPMLCYC
jgi:pumilio RNA-binding family